MALQLGAHAEKVQAVRELLATKGRREQGRFAFEGPTLLEEAARSGVAISEAFVTESVYSHNASVRALEERGTAVFLVDDRTMTKISDLDTPTGLVMTASMQLKPVSELLKNNTTTLVLADLNDPGNAGTLLRSAEAFGAGGVVFGRFGVDPYHPKVVRGAMGAMFRLGLSVAEPNELATAATAAQAVTFGLAAGGEPLRASAFAPRSVLVVGHERRGLGAWESVCARQLAIPMRGPTESLNAAVAGSIALYEASKR
jgi:TrmH family RNA methyltransferase